MYAIRFPKEYAINGGQVDCDPLKCPEPCRLRYLVVKSDSAYLVNLMISHIHKWRLNGWLTAKKTLVINRDLFELLIDDVEELETKYLIGVDFWLVPRERNTEADRLARLGLGTSDYFDE
jgi:ribonuclease HI